MKAVGTGWVVAGLPSGERGRERTPRATVLCWVPLSGHHKAWARWSSRSHVPEPLWTCSSSEGLGGGVVSRPRGGLRAAGNASSQLAPLSLHTQRLDMLQTQQWDANPRGGGRRQLGKQQLCFHPRRGARVLECQAADVTRGLGIRAHSVSLAAGTLRMWRVHAGTSTASLSFPLICKGLEIRRRGRATEGPGLGIPSSGFQSWLCRKLSRWPCASSFLPCTEPQFPLLEKIKGPT